MLLLRTSNDSGRHIQQIFNLQLLHDSPLPRLEALFLSEVKERVLKLTETEVDISIFSVKANVASRNYL